MPLTLRVRRAGVRWNGLGGDERCTATLEMAILTVPFITLLFAIMQLGIYFMAQAALDNGVLRTAVNMRTSMMTGAAYVTPTAAAVRSSIAQQGDVMLNGASIVVDLQQLPNLAAAVVPIADGTIDTGSSNSILVLRARVPVFGFAQGMTALTVTSTALIRRPAY